jgi:hypothetical protein
MTAGCLGEHHRPYSLVGAGCALASPVAATLKARTEGARDAAGPRGPTGLDASRHRGLSKLIVPQVRRSLGVPRAVFLRFAPHRPRWTYLSGTVPLLANWQAAYPPLSGPGRRCGPVTGCKRDAITGPRGARSARRDHAAWTAGWGISRRISDAPEPGHRVPPRVWRLQTPR